MALGLSGNGLITGFDPTASGFGKVLQVVTTIKSDRFTTTSGTAVDITDYSATITPASASNKILVMSSFHYGDGTTSAYGKFTLLRNSTIIGQGDSSGSSSRVTAANTLGNSNNKDAVNVSYNILDSPATTSAVTYKWQVRTFSSRTVTFNGSNTTADGNDHSTSSTIILMEVAA